MVAGGKSEWFWCLAVVRSGSWWLLAVLGGGRYGSEWFLCLAVVRGGSWWFLVVASIVRWWQVVEVSGFVAWR